MIIILKMREKVIIITHMYSHKEPLIAIQILTAVVLVVLVGQDIGDERIDDDH